MSAGVTPAVERAAQEMNYGGTDDQYHAAAGRVLAAALDVEEMARVQVAHDRRIWSSGEVECACGEWQVTRDAEGYKRTTREFQGEAVRAHMRHLAEAIRTALLGADS